MFTFGALDVDILSRGLVAAKPFERDPVFSEVNACQSAEPPPISACVSNMHPVSGLPSGLCRQKSLMGEDYPRYVIACLPM